jgi:hypothetical protein
MNVMHSTIAAVVVLFASIHACQAQSQNCLITGGTNFGTITQNCVINPEPAPLSIISKQFENKAMPDGTYQHQIFAQVGAPITLLIVACGDGVIDLGASPWPAGITSQTNKMTHENCVAYRYFNTTPGRWAMWVTTKSEDTKFTLQPIIQ